MLEMNLIVSGESPPTGIVGQANFTNGTIAETTTNWVCPPGVTSVCVVLVGGGQPGTIGPSATNIRGGVGGGLRYQNDIPVVPGQSYPIVVPGISTHGAATYYPNARTTPAGSRNTTAFGITVGLAGVGTAFSDVVKGGYGSNTIIVAGNSNASGGGSAGTFTNGPVDPYPANQGTTTVDGKSAELYGISGAGGGGYARGPNPIANGNLQPLSNGQPGAVRIIWGGNRAFPALNVKNF